MVVSICVFILEFCTITASLSAFSTGVTGGWMSPVLVQLQKDGGPLGSPVNMEQSSWMGSLMPVGAIIGSFMSGYLGARLYKIARTNNSAIYLFNYALNFSRYQLKTREKNQFL